LTANLKNPLTAKILSFFCPGLGQIYVGRILRGIVFFSGFVISVILIFGGIGLLLSPAVWIWSIYDAGVVADLYNQKSLLKTVEKAGKKK
jgi:TM2 domain.